MSKHRLCLHDFDHAHAVVKRLHDRVFAACRVESNRGGVSTLEDLSRALGSLDSAVLAVIKARAVAEDVL